MSNRVWIRSGGVFKAVIESADEIRWTRRYDQLGSLSMRVRRSVDGAEFLTDSLGDEISVIDTPGGSVPDLTFTIEALTFRLGSGGLSDDIVEVTAVESGLLHMRVALPPPHELPLGGSSHHTISGDAETAMRDVVDKNVGPSAPADRQYPGLVLDTNQNRGPTKDWKARFETVEQKLHTWAKTAELGYEVQFDASANQHTFKVLSGKDKSDKVEFSIRLDNVESQEWLENGSDQVSFAYIAGQGTGAERDMDGVYTGGSIPTGKSRREMFIDARDLESAADLPARGSEKLAERRIEETFSTEIDQNGPFEYKTDWDLGDIVTVKNTAWGITKAKRVVEIETVVKRSETQRKVTLGEAPKDLKTRVVEAIGDQATSRSVVFEQGVQPEGRIVGIRTFASGDNTIADDKGKLLEYTGSSAANLTISAGTHELRDTFYVQQVGSGALDLVADSGVSFRFLSSLFNSKLAGQGAMVTVVMVDDTSGAEVFALGGQLELA